MKNAPLETLFARMSISVFLVSITFFFDCLWRYTFGQKCNILRRFDDKLIVIHNDVVVVHMMRVFLSTMKVQTAVDFQLQAVFLISWHGMFQINSASTSFAPQHVKLWSKQVKWLLPKLSKIDLNDLCPYLFWYNFV